jgi:hypothetical protein
MDIVEVMLGTQEANKLKTIPLSDNTIQRRINHMADDIREQLVEKFKKWKTFYFVKHFPQILLASDCTRCF